MELVEGDDLSQRIARGAIPLDEALPIARQIAEAIEAARVDHVIKGDTVSEVLRYVQFDPEELVAKLRRDVEAAVHAGHLQDQLKFYEEGLQGYTYLEDPSAE